MMVANGRVYEPTTTTLTMHWTIIQSVILFWLRYTSEEIEKILTESVKKTEREKGNEIQIRVKERR
jgi:sulfur relay (sulfurtransferase) DsrC/TusE family protein